MITTKFFPETANETSQHIVSAWMKMYPVSRGGPVGEIIIYHDDMNMGVFNVYKEYFNSTTELGRAAESANALINEILFF